MPRFRHHQHANTPLNIHDSSCSSSLSRSRIWRPWFAAFSPFQLSNTKSNTGTHFRSTVDTTIPRCIREQINKSWKLMIAHIFCTIVQYHFYQLQHAHRIASICSSRSDRAPRSSIIRDARSIRTWCGTNHNTQREPCAIFTRHPNLICRTVQVRSPPLYGGQNISHPFPWNRSAGSSQRVAVL